MPSQAACYLDLMTSSMLGRWYGYGKAPTRVLPCRHASLCLLLFHAKQAVLRACSSGPGTIPSVPADVFTHAMELLCHDFVPMWPAVVISKILSSACNNVF